MQTNITEMKGFYFEYFIHDNMASHSIGIGKEWETHITKFIQIYHKIYGIQNIIDVGANFGYHTLFFSKEVNGNVFAFEPQLQNFQLLQKNIHTNQIQNILLFNLACGDQECDIYMPILEDDSTMKNMGDFTPNTAIENKYSITKSILLDNLQFTSKIDIMKIDVQGWEKKVLLGAHHLLHTHKPILIVEFEHFQLAKTNTSCKELFDFIHENNYSIFYLEYEYPSDHVCVHNDYIDDFRQKFQQYIFPHTQDNSINHNFLLGIHEKISIL